MSPCRVDIRGIQSGFPRVDTGYTHPICFEYEDPMRFGALQDRSQGQRSSGPCCPKAALDSKKHGVRSCTHDEAI